MAQSTTNFLASAKTEKLLIGRSRSLEFGVSETSGLLFLAVFQAPSFSCLALMNVSVNTGLSGRLSE